VLLHLAFPALLWLFASSTWVALATSILLYVSIKIFGIDLQGWPRGEWYFNPLAWQVLFVSGICFARNSSEKLRTLLRSPAMLACAISYLVFGLIVALSWQVRALDAFMPKMLSQLIYPIDKSNLDLLRLLHFFALALVVVRLTPQNCRGPSALWATAAIRCGENSLAIFCLSVLLSFVGHIVLVNTSGALLMQILVSMAGIGLMIVAATLLTWFIKSGAHQSQLF
jgi:hypothetical protein